VVGGGGRLDGPAARGPGVCLVFAEAPSRAHPWNARSGWRRRLRPSPETAT